MSYATVEQFTLRLGLSSPTGDQLDLAQQCLDAATQEIDSHLGWDQLEAPPELTPDQQALVELVNLERAAEHYRLLPFGALPQGPELPTVLTARDSFYRYQRKLASLETEWGVA